MLEKPATIANDSFKSQKWDEIVSGRKFAKKDIPTLCLLIEWYSVVERCIEDRDSANGQVAYMNDMGDMKALPQIATMKQASAEIRALNKQLGIDDTSESEQQNTGSGVLSLVQGKRAQRRTRTTA